MKLRRARWLRHVRGLAHMLLVAAVSSLLTVLVLLRWGEQGVQTVEAAASPPSASVIAEDPLAWTVAQPQTARPAPSPETRIYHQTNEAVVNITAESVEVVYDWFFQPQPRTNQSTGSGSIFDAQGYVITNSHVVKEADKLFITLFDGKQYPAEVKGIDYETDLAVLRFDPGERALTTIPFGDSSYLQVGEAVLAIGNPYGLERTLTKGIVSGMGRPIKNNSGIVIHDMIQTDASINPGNSGGPLLNLLGEMVGINTSIYSPSGGSVGIGFALPINSAKRVVEELIRYGKVQRGWIEVVPIQLFPRLARYAGLPVEQGLLISEVSPGGNAERAGLRGGRKDQAVRTGDAIIFLGGDIIVGINGSKVASLADLYSQLAKTTPGEQVSIDYLRSGRQGKLTLTLGKRPD